MSPRKRKLESFTPSKQLKEKAAALLAYYDHDMDEITGKLKKLSMLMDHNGTRVIEDETNNNLHVFAQAQEQLAIARDILEIGGMLLTVAKGSAIMRNGHEEGGNNYLALFDPSVNRVEPRIIRCLKLVGGHCLETRMDAVDRQTSMLLKQVKSSTSVAANDQILAKIQECDELGGFVVKMGDLAEAMRKEMAREQLRGGGGKEGRD
jgi:hypothetical protein